MGDSLKRSVAACCSPCLCPHDPRRESWSCVSRKSIAVPCVPHVDGGRREGQNPVASVACGLCLFCQFLSKDSAKSKQTGSRGERFERTNGLSSRHEADVRSDQILAFQCFRRGDAIGSARLGLEAPSNARAAVALRLMQVHSRSALPRLRLQGTGRRPARSARPRSANRWAAWPSGRYSGVRTSNRTVFCPPNGAGNSFKARWTLCTALGDRHKTRSDSIEKGVSMSSRRAQALPHWPQQPCPASRRFSPRPVSPHERLRVAPQTELHVGRRCTRLTRKTQAIQSVGDLGVQRARFHVATPLISSTGPKLGYIAMPWLPPEKGKQSCFVDVSWEHLLASSKV